MKNGIFSYQCDGDRLKEAVSLYGLALMFDVLLLKLSGKVSSL
jgi:hypothetical protein